jgi:N6-L-threonylcarbamoyladenine synthase
MTDDLVAKTMAAVEDTGAATLLVTGGVAANSELRTAFEKAAGNAGVRVYFPSFRLSTDNAAMIAAAAYPKFVAGAFAPEDLSAEAGLILR